MFFERNLPTQEEDDFTIENFNWSKLEDLVYKDPYLIAHLNHVKNHLENYFRINGKPNYGHFGLINNECNKKYISINNGEIKRICNIPWEEDEIKIIYDDLIELIKLDTNIKISKIPFRKLLHRLKNHKGIHESHRCSYPTFRSSQKKIKVYAQEKNNSLLRLIFENKKANNDGSDNSVSSDDTNGFDHIDNVTKVDEFDNSGQLNDDWDDFDYNDIRNEETLEINLNHHNVTVVEGRIPISILKSLLREVYSFPLFSYSVGLCIQPITVHGKEVLKNVTKNVSSNFLFGRIMSYHQNIRYLNETNQLKFSFVSNIENYFIASDSARTKLFKRANMIERIKEYSASIVKQFDVLEINGIVGRIEIMYDVGEQDLLQKIQNTVVVATKNLVCYSSKEIIGIAKLFHESLISIALTAQELINIDYYSPQEYYDVWTFAKYHLEHFFDGRLQFHSMHTYLPHISLLNNRLVYKFTYKNIEKILKEKALIKCKGGEGTLDNILKHIFNLIHPDLFCRTMSREKEIKEWICSQQEFVTGYDEFLKTAHRRKEQRDKSIPVFCHICRRFFIRDSVNKCEHGYYNVKSDKFTQFLFDEFQILNLQQQQVLLIIFFVTIFGNSIDILFI